MCNRLCHHAFYTVARNSFLLFGLQKSTDIAPCVFLNLLGNITFVHAALFEKHTNLTADSV